MNVTFMKMFIVETKQGKIGNTKFRIKYLEQQHAENEKVDQAGCGYDNWVNFTKRQYAQQ